MALSPVFAPVGMGGRPYLWEDSERGVRSHWRQTWNYDPEAPPARLVRSAPEPGLSGAPSPSPAPPLRSSRRQALFSPRAVAELVVYNPLRRLQVFRRVDLGFQEERFREKDAEEESEKTGLRQADDVDGLGEKQPHRFYNDDDFDDEKAGIRRRLQRDEDEDDEKTQMLLQSLDDDEPSVVAKLG